jgi:thiol-disulfide isomerase/thioredoxin
MVSVWLPTAVFACGVPIALAQDGPPSPAMKETAHAGASSSLLTIDVIGEDRRPLAGAQAYLIEQTYGLPLSLTWRSADESGRITFSGGDIDASMFEDGAVETTVILRAPGRAWTTHRVSVPAREPIKLGVPAGRFVEFTFKPAEGELPAGFAPFFFSEGNSAAAWLTVVQKKNSDHGEGDETKFNLAHVETIGAGRFCVRVPDDCRMLWTLVHHEGFLRAFQAGPFDREALDRGAIDVALPKPGSLTINIGPDADKPHQYRACHYELMCSPDIPDGGWSFQVARDFADGPVFEVTLRDLAPGGYSVGAGTGDRESYRQRERPDYFRTQAWAQVESGASVATALALHTFDEKWWREHLKGDHALTLTITRPDGSPAAGKRYALSFMLQQFGRNLEVTAGEVPASGEITVEGLPAGPDSILAINVDGQELGTIFIDPSEKHMRASFGVPPAVGEVAPDITLTRLDNGEKFALSSLRGKVVLLDFWASWCGPCQEPMAHNNTLLSKRSDWRDRVAIIGASIDDEIATIREHVNKREWNEVLQAFCGEGEPAWRSTAAKTYAVTAVPTAFLIDREGKVAWSGHPGAIDVEKEIDALLAK